VRVPPDALELALAAAIGPPMPPETSTATVSPAATLELVDAVWL
jgi:hypothetical protein